MSILIKGGRIITGTDDYTGDIFIAGETINQIGVTLDLPADRVIDARGKYILPGGVDPHVHNDEPFMGTHSSDDFYTGTVAAACGGTTTTIDFAYQTKGKPLAYALEEWQQKARGKAVIDYGFHIAVFEGDEKYIDEIPWLIERGITSFKVFMAYKGDLQVDDSTIFRLLLKCRDHGGLLLAHAENGDIIDTLIKRLLVEGKTQIRYHYESHPPESEAEATARVIELARVAQASIYIVHLSAAPALEAVQRARDTGQLVLAETTPHYLCLAEEDIADIGFEGSKYLCAPPIRKRANQSSLWSGLRNGSLQVVGTDHCTYNFRGPKEIGRNNFAIIPNGVPGIETRLYLLWNGGVRTGRISPHQFVNLVSTNPAKIFGLFPQKGTLAVGSDADIVIWDPDKEFDLSRENLHSNVDYSCYEGWKVVGAPWMVLARGEVIVLNNQFIGERGRGRFLHREPFSPLRLS
jgi:dihydropyrimidinase